MRDIMPARAGHGTSTITFSERDLRTLTRWSDRPSGSCFVGHGRIFVIHRAKGIYSTPRNNQEGI